jgi:hypothetical protein
MNIKNKNQEKPPEANNDSSNKNYKLLLHILMSIVMGVAIPFTVHSINKFDNLELDIGTLGYWIIVLLGLIVGAVVFHYSEKNGAIDNWENWAVVANNKGVSIAVALFTFSPMIIKTLNLVNTEFTPGLVFYSYWFCGLNLFFFILLFKLLAPKVYSYRDFDDFFIKSESFVHLRKSATEVKSFFDKKEVKSFENENLKSDIEVIESIIKNKVTSYPDAFKILRLRSTYTKAVQRTFVSIFILIPAYLIPLVFTANVFLVAKEASKLIEGKNSLLNALFGF